MGELEPASVRQRREEIAGLESTAITAAALGIVFELFSRTDTMPDFVEVADRVIAGGCGMVAVGALASTVWLRQKNRQDLASGSSEQG